MEYVQNRNTPCRTETIIVGAGASGLFCAWLLAKAKRPFILLERGNRVGRKLSISGGGHANFTNINIDASHFLAAENARFCERALNLLSVEKILKVIKSLGLNWVKKEKGRLFLEENASLLPERLLAPARYALRLNTGVSRIISEKAGYSILCPEKTFHCQKLILAPGSPARPRLANCPDCWKIMLDLDLPVAPPVPALTPLIFPDNEYADFKELAGLSIEARVAIRNLSNSPVFQDALLFTHFGLSGPAILNISLYFQNDSILLIDFLPQTSFMDLFDKNGKKSPLQLLRTFLPERLAMSLLPETLAHRRCAELSRADRMALQQAVHEKNFENLRISGLARAEVCSGGLSPDALDSGTMQVKGYPGLYVTGEAQNITGQLGGYNLHWAFASATCAAASICVKAVL